MTTIYRCSSEFNVFNFLIINRVDNTDLLYKRIRNEEQYEEYMADWKHKNKSLDFSNEIRTLLVNEIPTVVLDHKDKINPLFKTERIMLGYENK